MRADAVRNREKVLAAARDAFARDGLGVPIDDIARMAGVGAGTVYRHFPTKESLFEAVLADRVDALTEMAAAGIDLFAFIKDFAAHGGGNRALAEALTRGGIDVQLSLAGRSARLKVAVSDLLRRAQRTGQARPDVTADDLQALLAGVHLAAEQSGNDEHAVARMLAVVADGLRAR
jgi:AcrR family transcriptional regulator